MRTRRFPTTGLLTFPSGGEAHYGVLLMDIFHLSSVLSIPPGQTIFG